MIARSEITNRIPNCRHLEKRKYPKKWTHQFFASSLDYGHIEKWNDPRKWTEEKGNESKKIDSN